MEKNPAVHCNALCKEKVTGTMEQPRSQVYFPSHPIYMGKVLGMSGENGASKGYRDSHGPSTGIDFTSHD